MMKEVIKSSGRFVEQLLIKSYVQCSIFGHRQDIEKQSCWHVGFEGLLFGQKSAFWGYKPKLLLPLL